LKKNGLQIGGESIDLFIFEYGVGKKKNFKKTKICKDTFFMPLNLGMG
jgi:hypothetical protein